MTCYPRDQARREVAFIAYHFHWPRQELMSLSHLERRLWVTDISRINQEINEVGREASRAN
ncbi:DUF6760 family protein [Desulfobacter postgatei]|uniref:DUF6760 domain-containing protein n=1 Tax=Desulfobacter postgatei 2ac9 TaxID=879212 RepID=I5B7I2_9BACT|nr:hypothetical protein DespoDRAFT_03706 [Desulfobacter postgatei 2ac9]